MVDKTSAAGTPEQNLDKLLKQQERFFNLEIKKEEGKVQHDYLMSTARTLGQAAEKA